ncbi:hypothetical protein FRC0206_01224 [Corynebacterium diphtheriae]|nr:hypothetical protein FRC0205_01070 [Corynebacterium diphtheriae]CAB0799423.1 hypothetical protein FRC0206_01224 [Corynebacterium diphtheriae]
MRKLLLPDPHVIGRPQGTTSPTDAVGPEMIDSAPAELIAQLSEIVGKAMFWVPCTTSFAMRRMVHPIDVCRK